MDNIKIFPWNENFNTGISIIDEQHEKLVHLLNQLACKTAFTKDPDELSAILLELTDYAQYHFDTEERIWAEHLFDSSLLNNHQSNHRSFITKIQHLTGDQENRSTRMIIGETLEYLVRWLVAHIIKSDRHLAIAVQGISEGMTMPKALAFADVQLGNSADQIVEIIMSSYSVLTNNTLQLIHEIQQREKLEIDLTKARETSEKITKLTVSAERTLAEKEQLIEVLFESLPISAWLKHSSGVYISCTDSFARLHQRSIDQITGKTDFDLYDSNIADQCLRSDQKAISSKTTVIDEIRIYHKPDQHRLLRLKRIPWTGDSETAIGVLGIEY